MVFCSIVSIFECIERNNHETFILFFMNASIILLIYQLKNMIAALYSSKLDGSGTKSFMLHEILFGWKGIVKVYKNDLERAKRNQAPLVAGLKYAYIERDNWTRLNVRPAKIMQILGHIIQLFQLVHREVSQ